jgi:phage/plasmid-associated DNA primase
MMHHICHVLANGDPKAAEYILRWIAWGLQHPGDCAEVALVFRGGKGSGKGVFANAVGQMFGEHYLHVVNQDHVTGHFNAHLRACLFLFADECFWAGDKKAERVLKGLITEPTIEIEQKGVDVTTCINRLKMLMAANADWVVPASHDERRYAMFDVNNRYTRSGADADKSKAYFDALHQELAAGGLEAMMHDFMNWDLQGWHPRQVYETDALRKQKDLSMSHLEQWFEELLQEGRLPASVGTRPCVTTRVLIDDAVARVPQLKNRLGDKAMADFLTEQGCKKWRTNAANGWEFLTLAEHRGRWEQRYGGRVWDDPGRFDWQLPDIPRVDLGKA